MDAEHTHLQNDRDTYWGVRRALVEAITRQLRAGAPAMGVWRSVAPAFSRDQVKECAAALTAHDRARKTLAADPAEMPDVAGLPRRVREALRNYHLTLAATSGEHALATVEAMPLDGEPARVAKARPLT